MSEDIKCNQPKPCEPSVIPEPEPCSQPFNLCVGDRTLIWDGFCPTLERTRNTPDGTYTSVTVVDGCIVEYGYASEPTYTPPYCSPNPSSCQASVAPTDGESNSLAIAPNSDNAIALNTGGLFARTYIKGGDGVAVSGVGTIANPYTLTVKTTPNTKSTIVCRNGLVSENTDAVAYVGLDDSGVEAGVYDGTDKFTVDKHGRITAIEPREDPIVSAGAGLVVNPVGESLQVTHPTNALDDQMTIGGFTVTLNNSGHITDTQRVINLTSGVYNLGAYNVTLNEYGSVTDITQRTDVLPSAGEFRTLDGKVIGYDITGRLTGVDDANSVSSSVLPMPIRDMFKVIASDGISKEVYGTDTQITLKNGDVVITTPDYVSQRNQINIHGAKSWEFDIMRGVVVAVPLGNSPITITFRG